MRRDRGFESRRSRISRFIVLIRILHGKEVFKNMAVKSNLSARDKKVSKSGKISQQRVKVIKSADTKTFKATAEINTKSYKSLIYGGITVVLLIAMAFGVFRIISQNQRKNIADEGLKVANEINKENEDVVENIEEAGKISYTTAEGDTLWGISEKYYKTGFKWSEIANANKISNPSNLKSGVKLVIPQLQEEAVKVAGVTTEVASGATTASNGKSETSEYSVKEGDNLWDISVKIYGDGYKWVEVAKTNKLENPDLIYPDNKLVLPK